MIAPALQNEFARVVGAGKRLFNDASDLLTYSYDAALHARPGARPGGAGPPP